MFLCFEWTLFLILSAHCNEIQFLVVPTPAQGVNLLRNRLLSLFYHKHVRLLAALHCRFSWDNFDQLDAQGGVFH